MLATAIGMLSGYFGGRFDLLVQRGVDAWMAFPPLLLLLSIMSLLGPSVWNITIVLGIAFGIQNSRVVRGVALLIKEHTFVESARALGAGHARMTLTHILPNVMPTIIVVATTGLSTVILTEASLSFLGLGVPPPTRRGAECSRWPVSTTCTAPRGSRSGRRWPSRSPSSASTCWGTPSATSWIRGSEGAEPRVSREPRRGGGQFVTKQ